MLRVGIVGLPNIGKSTLFNAILKREKALSANYPFATIEPNYGIVDVYDPRLQVLADLVLAETKINPPIVYPTIEFVDIAGLVAGASKGEGLGNQFLANIRETDMIIQVVRDFVDQNIIREHSQNPDIDTETINTELIIKDIESIQKRIISIGKDKTKQKDLDILNQYLASLNNNIFAIELKSKIDPKDYLEIIKPLFLLTDKPMIYVFNVDELDPRLKATQDTTYKDKPQIFINAKLESELASLPQNDQQSYLQSLGILQSGLDKITAICFKDLGLISFLTVGVKEVRGWEIKSGSTAKESAGKIHTDFMDKFIKAEIIKYSDYILYKTRQGCRDAGKLRLEGKEYIVQDGDIIEFKIGA